MGAAAVPTATSWPLDTVMRQSLWLNGRDSVVDDLDRTGNFVARLIERGVLGDRSAQFDTSVAAIPASAWRGKTSLALKESQARPAKVTLITFWTLRMDVPFMF